MLTEPRLRILEPTGVISRARRAAVEKMFGGLYPAAIHVTLVKTCLSRTAYCRFHLSYSRPTTA